LELKMATMTDNIQSMIDTLSDALGDASKHDKGNKAAGTRLRKAMQTVAVSCKEGRKQVSADRNA
jgi:hypothetical protein